MSRADFKPTADDIAELLGLMASQFGAWKPMAVICLKYPDGWSVSAAFQGTFRALRHLKVETYDKPVALVCQADDGADWHVEFVGV